MSDESYLVDHKKERRWLSRLAKLVFFVIAFFLITLVVLFNMGGTSDLLRESAEKLVSEIFDGRPARIGKLVNISFFPRVGIDAHDIHVLSSQETPYPVIKMDKFQAYMESWRVLTGKPRFSHVYLENFHAMGGILNPQDVKIDKVFIDHDAIKGQAFLRGSGSLGVHRWSASWGLEVIGSGKSRRYSFMTRAPFVFDIADLHFEAMLHDHPDGYFKLEDAVLSSEKYEISGDFALSSLGDRLLKIQGEMKTSGGQTHIHTDLVFDLSQNYTKISGDISAPSVLFDDISTSEKGQFSGIYRRIRHILGYDMVVPGVTFDGYDLNFDLDVNVDIQKIIMPLRRDDITSENLSLSIFKEGGFWRIRPVMHDEKQRFPFVTFVPDRERFYAVIQSGYADVSFMKLYLPFVFANIDDALDIECGLVSTIEREGKYYIDRFVMQSAQGDIDRELDHPYESRDFIALALGDEAIAFPNVTLSRDAYDFVQGTFQETGRDVPCAAYITKDIEGAKKEKPQGGDFPVSTGE